MLFIFNLQVLCFSGLLTVCVSSQMVCFYKEPKLSWVFCDCDTSAPRSLIFHPTLTLQIGSSEPGLLLAVHLPSTVLGTKGRKSELDRGIQFSGGDQEGTCSVGQGGPQDQDGALRECFSEIKLRLTSGRLNRVFQANIKHEGIPPLPSPPFPWVPPLHTLTRLESR